MIWPRGPGRMPRCGDRTEGPSGPISLPSIDQRAEPPRVLLPLVEERAETPLVLRRDLDQLIAPRQLALLLLLLIPDNRKLSFLAGDDRYGAQFGGPGKDVLTSAPTGGAKDSSSSPSEGSQVQDDWGVPSTSTSRGGSAVGAGTSTNRVGVAARSATSSIQASNSSAHIEWVSPPV